MNPELRRNIWLELSPQRLIALPLILAVTFALAVGVGGKLGSGHLAIAAATIYWLLAIVWGSRLAGDAVASEIAARTWDSQRLTPIGPWTMAVGKLTGSTVFAWLGAGICLAAYVLDNPERLKAAEMAKLVLALAVAALSAQAFALLTSLQVLRLRRRGGAVRTTAFQILGIMAGSLPFVAAFLSFPAGTAIVNVSWFGYAFVALDFVLFSSLLVLGFTLLGIYHLMRLELLQRNHPWAWLAFIAVAMAYAAGHADVLGRATGSGAFPAALAASATAALLTYVMAFLEPKDVVQLRQLGQALREADLAGVLARMPRWGLTFIVALGGAASVVALAPEHGAAGTVLRYGQIGPVVASACCLLARDVALLLSLGLDSRSRRGEAAAVVYLMVLYLVLPGLLSVIGLRDVARLLLPVPGWGWPGVLAHGAQAAAALAIVSLAWRAARRRAAPG